MKKIYIATPSYDAKVYAGYTFSILNYSEHNNIKLKMLCGDSLITRARNFMVSEYYHKFAKLKKFDYFLFQDSDVQTNKNSLYFATNRNVDVLFAPIPLKNEEYESPFGLIQTVIGIKEEVEPFFYKATLAATGFCLLSNEAIIALVENAEKNNEYYFDSTEFKIYDIFKTYANEKHFYFSEDWHLCQNLTRVGFDIHIDSSFEVWHWSAPESCWYRPRCALSENVLNNDFSTFLPEEIKNQRWVTNDFSMDLKVLK